MAEVLSVLPGLSAALEKGGVIFLLLLICGVLAWAVLHLRRELAIVYRQLSRAQLALMKCKTLLEVNKIAVDLADVKDLIVNGESN